VVRSALSERCAKVSESSGTSAIRSGKNEAFINTLGTFEIDGKNADRGSLEKYELMLASRTCRLPGGPTMVLTFYDLVNHQSGCLTPRTVASDRQSCSPTGEGRRGRALLIALS